MLEPVRCFGSLGLPLLPLPISGLFGPRITSVSPNNDQLDKMLSSASSTDSNGAPFDFPLFDGNGETPTAKVIEYRREKLACFDIGGVDMICLPQAYELFLKNLVGGLHTVYTKLKRLEITPLVCNVEQVRALRSLGAIQPGVNRCKLIAANDFDKLYEDCTSRPGRPAKRLASMDDWAVKHPRTEGAHDPPPGTTATTSGSTGMLLSQFLPFSHQLLVQQMMALSAVQQQHPEPARHQLRNGDEEEEEVDVEEVGQSLSSDSAPLNLSKNENQNSETSDNDSLENMRKDEDAQMSERGGSSGSAGSAGSSAVSTTNSSNQSMNVAESSLALRKIIGLLDIANEHFKVQREMLAKEREDLDAMKVRMKKAENHEESMRVKLEAERKRARVYFNRFCKAQKEALSLKEQLLAVNNTSFDQSEQNQSSTSSEDRPT